MDSQNFSHISYDTYAHIRITDTSGTKYIANAVTSTNTDTHTWKYSTVCIVQL